MTNVHLGVHNGALTMLKAEHPWLVLIHCANLRLALEIKDAVKGIVEFAECGKFQVNWKQRQKRPAKHLTLPKIHGTNFVSHQRQGFTKLLQRYKGTYHITRGCCQEIHSKIQEVEVI